MQFTCTNLDGSQKEGGNFFNLLQKEGGTQKGVAGVGGSLRKGRVRTLEETMIYRKYIYIYIDRYITIMKALKINNCKTYYSRSFSELKFCLQSKIAII